MIGSRTCRCWEISKKLTLSPTLTAKNTPLFLFHTWVTRFKYLPEGCPYMLMYLAFFTPNAVVLSHFRCVHPQNKTKYFLILTFLWIKTNVACTTLEVIAKQYSALQVEFITGVKLICNFVLYYCFLHWAHLPNMAVGDLAFYYTLYLCIYHVLYNLINSPLDLPQQGKLTFILLLVVFTIHVKSLSYMAYTEHPLHRMLVIHSML